MEGQNIIEKPNLTPEEKKFISDMTNYFGGLLDTYINSEVNDKGRNVLTKVNQLIKNTNDPVIKVLLKNIGDLLDTSSDIEGENYRVLKKAKNLSQEEIK